MDIKLLILYDILYSKMMAAFCLSFVVEFFENGSDT